MYFFKNHVHMDGSTKSHRSPHFSDEPIEMLSDEEYLINTPGVLFGGQRLAKIRR